MIPLKFTKAQVGFEHPAQGPDHCGECKYFLGGRCAIVAGTVLSDDWCRKFSHMTCTHKGECFGACGVQRSPAEINHAQGESARKQAMDAANAPKDGMHEHDKVKSRLGGKDREISMGPHGGGLVPANPFASLAQEGFLHAHPEKLGKAGLEEWDASTKDKKLPEHVKK